MSTINFDPVFRKKKDGSVVLQDTRVAQSVRAQQRETRYVPPLPNNKVRSTALEDLKKADGDVSNTCDLLGFYRIQFGQFRGETFRWILENSPGYVGYLVNSMAKDKPDQESSDRFLNKMALKKYVESFPEGIEVIDRKSSRPSQVKVSLPVPTQPPVQAQSQPQLSVPARSSELNLDKTLPPGSFHIQPPPFGSAPSCLGGRAPAPSRLRGPTQAVLHPRGPTQAVLHPRGPTQAVLHPRGPTQAVLHPRGPTTAPSRPRGPTTAVLHPRGPSQAVLHPRGPTTAPCRPRGPTQPVLHHRGPTTFPSRLSGPAAAAAPSRLHGPSPGPSRPSVPTTAPSRLRGPAQVPSRLSGPTQAVLHPRGPTQPVLQHRGPTTAPSGLSVRAQGPSCLPVPAQGPSRLPVTARGPSRLPVRAQGPQCTRGSAPLPPLPCMPASSPTLPQVPAPAPSRLPMAATGQHHPQGPAPAQYTVQVPADTQTSAQDSSDPVCLPAGWKKTLPKEDHGWVSKQFFTPKPNKDIYFMTEKVDKLWWHPPPPNACPTAAMPNVDKYFAHSLFMWMPRKLWRVKLTCPHSEYEGELTSAGLHQKIRHVVDIDSSYNLASEYLKCNKCQRKVIAWSNSVISQLDVGHQTQFPCLLTSKLACDIKVIRLLRSRGLGNSSSQMHKKLLEQHTESWMQKTIQYLTDCKGFSRAAATGLITPMTFPDPPPFKPVPKHRWLMQVYCQDVLHRLDEIKASTTSVFGNVLKIDSTKKIVKKLAGKAEKTAVWCTNIGNEHGQVLASVLTAAEGSGIAPLLDGIMKRYQGAEVPDPSVLYTDRDCCGNTHLLKCLAAWEHTHVRLDIWHFMRRISAGLTTDSHQLYGPFMASLSNCLFEWDSEDMNRLIEAKKKELELQKGIQMKDEDVKRGLKRKELSLHCQRRTRGEASTSKLIEDLLDSYSGAGGLDTLGVPLINKAKMDVIWTSQQRHVACIQDPPGVTLYTQTGSIRKAGNELPVYRCARGSTSLESFHLHLNRFVPGTLASDVNFQAYLLDGVFRWNQDRAVSAIAGDVPDHLTYSGALQNAVNTLGEEVLGRKICPSYKVPLEYTGELFGIEYLYNQTGKVLEDYKMTINQRETEDDNFVTDDLFEDEGFVDELEDLTVPLLSTPEPQKQFSQTASDNDNIPATQDPQHHKFPAKRLPLPLDPDFTEFQPPALPLLNVNKPSLQSPLLVPTTAEPPSTFDIPIATETIEESVDDENIQGFMQIQDLALYLVSLLHSSLALTIDQARHIVELWNNLADHDKGPTHFSPRYAKISTGRFRATKRVQGVTEGVESTQRCFRGPNQGPAQWPDCNRYTKAVVVELCRVYPGDVRKSNQKMTRFGLILAAYNHIRGCVVNNFIVMRDTHIQLPEINRATLNQWFNKYVKDISRKVASQGNRFCEPEIASTGPPLEPFQKPTSIHIGNRYQHSFPQPEDTSGTAKIKIRHSKYTPVQQPSECESTFVITAPISIAPAQEQLSQNITKLVKESVPYTTERYRKRKLQQEEEDGVKKRKYERKKEFKACKKCGNDRTTGGHSQYFGNIYCPETAIISLENWIKPLREKNYGKKKK